MNHTSYTLKNVLLETGFEYEGDEVIKTNTALFSVEIADGKIKNIKPDNHQVDAIDVKGRLMLLDKMLFGLPWQAVSAKRRTVRDMIAYEEKMIPEWLKTSVERTVKMIDFLQRYGTDFIRSHFNVDPTSGLDSLYHLEEALAQRKESLDTELVAFPQHGIYYTQSGALLKEAAKIKSVGFIGGVDPYSIDGGIEKPMELITQLALDNGKGIDLHLHESGESGVKTIEFLIDKVNENPQLKGKTFVSHAFALGHMDANSLEKLAERLSHAGVGIVSSVPFRGTIMPIPTLKKHGVEVLIGNDNIQDHWSTFGTWNMLQKTNLIAELYGYVTEWQLSRTLAFATRSILPLDDNGNQQWPKAGDAADFVLIDASCSAETVARISPVTSLTHKGKMIF